ncbi:cell wall metabolism sensor histidine kinase WalK [Nocardioides sp. CFH 31398]|uniref:sensor histidine kinase n=1 Tax=Nocardioides sp. CFH 31398 TaxID=2919579 RepID=UPI001F05AFD8|nr:HAMP domain-containing sensor histidine kinase [Nocardioides sp. CFH 31398]MCH1868475.1 HAMP domain-containing histidine kinase [Nocardioides sp. CFH 31398]
MTTTGTTTESSPRRRLPGAFSVRTRITVVITVLAAMAMAGAGLLVYVLEAARVERQTVEQVDQETAEFRALQRGLDPDTGQPFRSAEQLLELFIQRNVPDDDEMLVIYPPGSGRPTARTPNRDGDEVLAEPGYREAVDDLARTGGTRVLGDFPYGETWVTVVPVREEDSPAPGALVIVNFLADERDEISNTIETYAIVALLSLGLIVLLAGSQSGRLLAPLRTLRETAEDIGTTDLSRRIPERGNDDITALTRTVNTMLDRLEDGFGAQRQFLDDAGHELKTPLTVLRGHLELLDPRDATDVEETRELLLEEIDRMSRLVGDLILLAKAGRPDFTRLRPVGVDTLTRGVLARARALGDRAWQDDGVSDAHVEADAQRLTQALLQLADNAVKHTGPGDVVAVGSSADATAVRLWVRDTGDGVPEEDRGRIFQRFGRSIVRDGDEGFGLGLSIVAAIVAAHHGTVHVEDAEPRGSRFVLTLPRTAPPRTDRVPASDPAPTPEEQPWPAS